MKKPAQVPAKAKAPSKTAAPTQPALKQTATKTKRSASEPKPQQIESLYESICTLLKILTVGEDLFAPAGGKIKYNGTDFQALGFIGRNPGCMATQISEFLGVSATTTTSALDRLVKQELVIRSRPETNRRAVALELSKQGQEAFQAMVSHDMRSMVLILQVLNADERDLFVEQMARICSTFIALQAAPAALEGKA
jgi:DNA-binding MarR family transcriptional regulator